MFFYLFDVTEQKETYDALPDNEAPPDAQGGEPTSTTANGSHYQQQPQKQPKTRRISIDDAIDAGGISWRGPQGRLFVGISLLLLVDSSELVVLAFLSKALDARIPDYHDDMLAWAGVGGALIGAVFLGSLGDWWGRCRVTLVVSLLVTVFGVLTALLPPTSTALLEKEAFVVQGLLLSRFLVGFGLGGITVPYDLLAEWLPNYVHHPPGSGCSNRLLRRGQVLLLVHASWSIGSLLVFALLETQTPLSPEKGKLTGIELWWCTVPAILATAVFLIGLCNSTLLESPRFLLARGREDEALRVLRRAAVANGKDPDRLFPDTVTLVLYSRESQPPAPENAPSATGPLAAICSLFSLRWLQLSSALLFTYFGQAFCYHGTASMLVAVFEEDEHEQKYQAVLSAVAELLGIGLLLGAIEPCGRVLTQVVAYAGAALACLTLAVWFTLPFLENGNVLIALTFLARMLVFGGGCTTWVSTTEILGTNVRTTGHAIAAGIAGRLGAFLGTIALPLVDYIPILALIVFAVSFWIAFAAGDIPETRMKEMGRSYNLLGQTERWGWWGRRGRV